MFFFLLGLKLDFRVGSSLRGEGLGQGPVLRAQQPFPVDPVQLQVSETVVPLRDALRLAEAPQRAILGGGTQNV